MGVREAERQDGKAQRGGAKRRTPSAASGEGVGDRHALRATDAALPADRPHAQALHRRQAGAARLGLQSPGARRRPARRRARSATATARTSATRSRRRTRRRAGRGPPRTTGRRCSTTSPRTWRPGRDEFARRLALLSGRRRGRRARGGARDRAHLHLRRVGRQVRRPVHHTPFRNVTLAMHEPIGVARRRRAPTTAPLLGFLSAGAARRWRWATPWSPCRPSRGPLAGDRSLPGARHLRRARRGDQHRHRRPGRARPGARRARRRRRPLVLRAPREGSAEVERLSAGNMKRTWVDYGQRAGLGRRRGARGRSSSRTRRRSRTSGCRTGSERTSSRLRAG